MVDAYPTDDLAEVYLLIASPEYEQDLKERDRRAARGMAAIVQARKHGRRSRQQPKLEPQRVVITIDPHRLYPVAQVKAMLPRSLLERLRLNGLRVKAGYYSGRDLLDRFTITREEEHEESEKARMAKNPKRGRAQRVRQPAESESLFSQIQDHDGEVGGAAVQRRVQRRGH